MNHTDVIEIIAKGLPFHDVYVELGVQYGSTFNRVSPLFSRSIAVDKQKLFETSEFYEMCTDEFFDRIDLLDQVDLVFVDADHHHDQSTSDFVKALSIVKPLVGLVVLHDTYPDNEDQLSQSLCGDSWKTAVTIRRFPSLEVVTLPIYYGLTICRSIPNNGHIHWMN